MPKPKMLALVLAGGPGDDGEPGLVGEDARGPRGAAVAPGGHHGRG